MQDRPMLRAGSNFERWHDEFKELATSEEVWDLITGVEKHLQRPEEPWVPAVIIKGHLYPGKIQNKKRKKPHAEEEDDEIKAILDEAHRWNRRSESYCDQLQKYQKQKYRIFLATRLIEATVEEDLLAPIWMPHDPCLLYRKLLQNANGKSTRPFNLTMRQLLGLRLTDCRGIHDYLQQCKDLRAKAVELHPDAEQYSDTHFIAKLIAGLTDNYNDFVEKWELCPEEFGSGKRDVDMFCKAVLEEEQIQAF